ncbi:MAG: histone family protein [Candidatus Altiarchaeales archaeon]|nr:histone family protein [Candidatus Altiarchaeota archaeon]MBU4341764.1 histone family protein [Candidatus Altiarchaeota archaeon]MBU4406664.1 histone family protein [Candidatus Altiarchaeota archaeon]MBU4437646.1 histone family protein [Candidatus Altiarchaeota archaeon]MCG2782195.1 histone family protein [Candidatus Altiarchaeales archaeon]
MTDIPLASVERLMRKAGADRVSVDGAKELRDTLEEIGRGISERAAKFAKHAGRKTVKAEDVKLAK